MTDHLAQTSATAGVSIWLDDLSRERIASGSLQQLIDDKHVVGVTTNPTIFAAALTNGAAYDAQVRELAAAGRRRRPGGLRDHHRGRPAGLRHLPADLGGHRPRRRQGLDRGRARGWPTTPTARSSRPSSSGRPSTGPTSSSRSRPPLEGLPAITRTLAEGISVNVTLIFSLDRYRGVMNAFLTGLEQAREAGHDLSEIHSVASFFVSRVDTEIDQRLDRRSAPTRPTR